MTHLLPPNLLALFAPRPPLRWIEPGDHAPAVRKTASISSVAQFLPALQEYKETDHYEPTESWLEKKMRLKEEKKISQEKLLKDGPASYKPHEDPNIRGDAFKTLIVARLSYQADEKDLESEFGRFGPIERIRIVVDTHQDEKPNKKKKPHRGYAFVVYEREKDMRAALENLDGIQIRGRRIKVDVERGRTGNVLHSFIIPNTKIHEVKSWLPSRLGKGLGGRNYTKAAPPRPVTGFNAPPGPGGFNRGRGGFDGGRGRGGFRPFQDRPAYGGGGRGGIGFQGGRGGSANGAPFNAPSGPTRGNFRGSYGGPDRNGSAPAGGYERSRYEPENRSGGFRGGRDYGAPQRGASGSNSEPVRERQPRDGGHRDRDPGYPPREEESRKRGYENNGYDQDPRKLRRY